MLVGSAAEVDLKLLELLVEVVTANRCNAAGHVVSLSTSHSQSPPACLPAAFCLDHMLICLDHMLICLDHVLVCLDHMLICPAAWLCACKGRM